MCLPWKEFQEGPGPARHSGIPYHIWTCMGEKTGIAWCDHTANFWFGCLKVSPECANCYAEERVTKRMRLPVWGPEATTERKLAKGVWDEVPKWNRKAKKDGIRRRMFASSLSDIFEDHWMVVPWRKRAFGIIEECRDLDTLLLTKRPENVLDRVPQNWLTHWPAHVWVGATAGDRARLQLRAKYLEAIPAPTKFWSFEPLLEDLGSIEKELSVAQWAIVGGESGPRARPFDMAWARNVVAQCRALGVIPFVKQMGKVVYVDGVRITLKDSSHGGDPEEWPEDLRIQEFPRTVFT